MTFMHVYSFFLFLCHFSSLSPSKCMFYHIEVPACVCGYECVCVCVRVCVTCACACTCKHACTRSHLHYVFLLFTKTFVLWLHSSLHILNVCIYVYFFSSLLLLFFFNNVHHKLIAKTVPEKHKTLCTYNVHNKFTAWTVHLELIKRFLFMCSKEREIFCVSAVG